MALNLYARRRRFRLWDALVTCRERRAPTPTQTSDIWFAALRAETHTRRDERLERERYAALSEHERRSEGAKRGWAARRGWR
jgi:hypothetical protein